jgi:hypothetical protein
MGIVDRTADQSESEFGDDRYGSYPYSHIIMIVLVKILTSAPVIVYTSKSPNGAPGTVVLALSS